MLRVVRAGGFALIALTAVSGTLFGQNSPHAAGPQASAHQQSGQNAPPSSGAQSSGLSVPAALQIGFADCGLGKGPMPLFASSKAASPQPLKPRRHNSDGSDTHVSEVPCGETVTILEIGEGWLRVRTHQGFEGYMGVPAVSKNLYKWVPFVTPEAQARLDAQVATEQKSARAQSFVASDPRVERSGYGFATFRHKREIVWNAIAEIMTTYDWRPQTMDSASGVVFFESQGQWGAYWGSNNVAVAQFTTKKVSKLSTWQHIALKMNLFAKSLDTYRTEVRLSATFMGCNGWQAAFDENRNCRWEPLQSNGQLEQQILDNIRSKLPEVSQAELSPPSTPDAKVVSLAREEVNAFERITAAFELGASTDRLMDELISTKASMQTFSESSASATLPRFTAALVASMQYLVAAVHATDKQQSFEAAKRAFTEAKDHLRNYEKYLQEVAPPEAKRMQK